MAEKEKRPIVKDDLESGPTGILETSYHFDEEGELESVEIRTTGEASGKVWLVRNP